MVWLRPQDCGKVSTEIGTEEWGLSQEDALAALSLTLEFGGCGSPGEWVPHSWGLKEAHSHVYPAQPEWHGTECFSSSYLVDDQTILEPGIGRRPWMSKRAAKRKTKALLGDGASNDDKESIEGHPSVSQIMWGLIFDSLAKKIGMPEVKLIKAAFIFGDCELDYGFTRVKVHTLQVLRGNAEWFQIVLPGLRPWLAVMDLMMKGIKPGQVYIRREDVGQELWEEFMEMIEAFRVMIARPELWESDFTNSLVGMLAPEELLSRCLRRWLQTM